MTQTEILNAAYKLVVDGAESRAEDWYDEAGKYEGYEDEVFDAQMAIIDRLRDTQVTAHVLAGVVI